jgi:hypothetical protein
MSCVSAEWIEAFKPQAPYYGLTARFMDEVCRKLPLLTDLTYYREVTENACGVFYFALLDKGRQSRLRFRQRDEQGNWRDFRDLMREISGNDSEGETWLSMLAPFAGIDPYNHFITFQLQPNNNRAIGNPSVKTNQADIVVTDVVNRRLYVIEAKMSPEFNHDQLSKLIQSIDELTRPTSQSFFANYQGVPILLLDRFNASPPITFAGRSIPIITWAEVAQILSDVGISPSAEPAVERRDVLGP